MRSILFAAVIALIACTTVSCRRAADPRQIAAVDSLITALDAVRLTLNELDTQHYAAADSILQANRVLFLQRFADTLDRTNASTLGDQFVQLREASRRATDHRNVSEAAAKGTVRLKQLKQDLSTAALAEEEGARALANEATAVATIENSVLEVITNYRSTQRALERQLQVDSLLVDTLLKRRTR